MKRKKEMKLVKMLGICLALLLLMAVFVPACSADDEGDSGSGDEGSGDESGEDERDQSDDESGDDEDEDESEADNTSSKKKKVKIIIKGRIKIKVPGVGWVEEEITIEAETKEKALKLFEEAIRQRLKHYGVL